MILAIIKNLSFHSGERYLLDEGYVEEECIERDDKIYDKVFIFPYVLYDESGKMVDRIGSFEYGYHGKPPLDDEDDYDIVLREWRRF